MYLTCAAHDEYILRCVNYCVRKMYPHLHDNMEQQTDMFRV